MLNMDYKPIQLSELLLAAKRNQTYFSRTPLLFPDKNAQNRIFGDCAASSVSLKLENMQSLGSFKIRGVVNQFHCHEARCNATGDMKRNLITMSAGNYGKAFAYCARKMGFSGTVVMPDKAPVNRQHIIEGYGSHVIRKPVSELETTVKQLCDESGFTYFHSYDDRDLIIGHSSCGLEILEDCPNPDIVLVACGGAGLIAGISSAIRLSGKHNTRIYAVEPHKAASLHQSYITGKAAKLDASSIASGLAAPSTGELCFEICKQNKVEKDVLLVTEEQLVDTTRILYECGLVVEPAGAATIAAMRYGLVPNVANKNIVCVVSGGNVTPEELQLIFNICSKTK